MCLIIVLIFIGVVLIVYGLRLTVYSLQFIVWFIFPNHVESNNATKKTLNKTFFAAILLDHFFYQYSNEISKIWWGMKVWVRKTVVAIKVLEVLYPFK